MFTWRAMPQAIRYSLELLDDRGARMFQVSVRDTSLVLPDSVSLVLGRTYSWWVREELPWGEGPGSAVVTFSLQAP